MDAKNTWDFLLVLDRPMTPQDEDVFDHMPEFADGKVSLLLIEGEPTVLACEDMEAPRLAHAVEVVSRNIGKINGLRVISVQGGDLASATLEDFGEVESPYEPQHPKLAIVQRRSYRYQILDIRGGHYLLRALFGSREPDYVWWKCKDADKHLKLEWVPPGLDRFGLIEDVDTVARSVTDEELKERGLG